MKIVVFSMLLLLSSVTNAIQVNGAQKTNAIHRVEEYLNHMRSLEASFVQTAYDNSKRNGKLYVNKPNKVRLEYLKPNPEILLVDDEFIYHYLPDLDEMNFMSNEGLPIMFLSKSHINLQKDFKITSVNEFDGQTEIFLELNYKNQKNTLVILFNNSPMSINKISVIDDTGSNVEMKVTSSQINHTLPNKLFEIKRFD